MSRVGKQPIQVPGAVKVDIREGRISVKGPKGEAARELPAGLSADLANGVLTVKRADESARTRAMHGTYRTLVQNMIAGVQAPYLRELEIQGVGFKASLAGRVLTLNLGYSHEIKFPVPAGIEVKVTDNTQLAVSGVDKQLVGEVAAQIRSYYKAEPYKGKGVRYKGENVRRKVGKAVS
jgi:large subunit ribosomal protein L6